MTRGNPHDVEIVGIDPEEDWELADAAENLAAMGPLGMSRTRDVRVVAVRESSSPYPLVVGALFDSVDDAGYGDPPTYSFDIAIDTKLDAARRHGVFTRLVKAAMETFEDLRQGPYPELYYHVHVVHPYARAALERHGFEVTERVGEGQWLMTKNNPRKRENPLAALRLLGTFGNPRGRANPVTTWVGTHAGPNTAAFSSPFDESDPLLRDNDVQVWQDGDRWIIGVVVDEEMVILGEAEERGQQYVIVGEKTGRKFFSLRDVAAKLLRTVARRNPTTSLPREGAQRAAEGRVKQLMKDMDRSIRKYRTFHEVDPHYVDVRKMWVPGGLVFLGAGVECNYGVIVPDSAKDVDAKYVHKFEKNVKVYRRARKGEQADLQWKNFPKQAMVLGLALEFTWDDGEEALEHTPAQTDKLACTPDGKTLVVVGRQGVKFLFKGGKMKVTDWIYH